MSDKVSTIIASVIITAVLLSFYHGYRDLVSERDTLKAKVEQLEKVKDGKSIGSPSH